MYSQLVQVLISKLRFPQKSVVKQSHSVLGTGHFLRLGGGGGFWGAIQKFSSLKGSHPKNWRWKRFFTGKCTGLMGHSRENWRGGHVKFFRDNQKTTAPLPIKMNGPLPHKQIILKLLVGRLMECILYSGRLFIFLGLRQFFSKIKCRGSE